MTWNSYRTKFEGKLGGITPKDFELDKDSNDVLTLQARMEVIKKKIEEIDPFLTEYFYTKEYDKRDNGESIGDKNDKIMFFNYKPSRDEELSFDINICKYLESYVTYLLSSVDMKKDKQEEYTILDEEDFKEQLQKEIKYPDETDSSIVLDMRPSNKYTNMKQKITPKDLKSEQIREEDKYLAEVLDAYDKLKQILKSDLAKMQNRELTENGFSLKKLRFMLSTVNDDMILAKNKIVSIRPPATKLGDERTIYDFSQISYKNPKHIQFILKYCKMGHLRPNDPMSEMAYDLSVAIDKLYKSHKIDKIDMEIINCYNTGTYSMADIAAELNRSKATIKQRIYKICKRVAKII